MMRSLIGTWFDNILLGVPARSIHMLIDILDRMWLLEPPFFGLFNEGKKGERNKDNLLSIIDFWSDVNIPLVLYLTQNMSLEENTQKINQ